MIVSEYSAIYLFIVPLSTVTLDRKVATMRELIWCCHATVRTMTLSRICDLDVKRQPSQRRELLLLRLSSLSLLSLLSRCLSRRFCCCRCHRRCCHCVVVVVVCVIVVVVVIAIVVVVVFVVVVVAVDMVCCCWYVAAVAVVCRCCCCRSSVVVSAFAPSLVLTSVVLFIVAHQEPPPVLEPVSSLSPDPSPIQPALLHASQSHRECCSRVHPHSGRVIRIPAVWSAFRPCDPIPAVPCDPHSNAASENYFPAINRQNSVIGNFLLVRRCRSKRNCGEIKVRSSVLAAGHLLTARSSVSSNSPSDGIMTRPPSTPRHQLRKIRRERHERD